MWRIGLWLLAAAAALLPWTAAWVERAYSRGLFPLLQPALTTFSNLVPFALFDLILALVIGGFFVCTARDIWRRSDTAWRRTLRGLSRLATIASVAYLTFLLCWGLNYRRLPIESRIEYAADRITHEALIALANRTVTVLNTLYEPTHRQALARRDVLDADLATAFAETQRQLGGGGPFVAGRPKRTWLDGYFRRAGVAGMTDPYLLETLIASDLLAVERPMVIAHEWSHLAGIADEGEANFAGWLTCLRGTPFHQYSAWLFLYSEVASELAPAELRRIAASLGEGPRADLQAVRDRLLKNINPALSTAGWRVYDQYLKANRIDAGTRSYAQVVRLVLATPYDDRWTPAER